MRKSALLWSAIVLALISDALSTDIKEEFKKEVKSTHSSFSTGVSSEDVYESYKDAVSNLHIPGKLKVGLTNLKLFSEQNYEPAILTLASLYKLGELIDQDLEKSINLYKKLPENPDALISLGSIYHSQGEFDDALKYYKEALEKGHPFAQRNIEQLKLDSE